MTKEEVIAAVQECATKLGHAPSMGEFRKTTAIGKGHIGSILARLDNC